MKSSQGENIAKNETWHLSPCFPSLYKIDKCQTEGEAELNKSCSWVMDSNQNGNVCSCYDNINAVCLIKTAEVYWQLAQNIASWQSRRETPVAVHHSKHLCLHPPCCHGSYLSNEVAVEDLEHFIESKFTKALHRVTNKCWRPTLGQTPNAILAKGNFETIDNVSIFLGVYLQSLKSCFSTTL